MAVAFTRNYPAAIGAAASGGLAGNLKTMYCQLNITTAFANGNTADLGYLPDGAVPVGGYFAAVDIDTGTEALDIDIGITANGVDSADPDFFSNSGVLTGDAIATDLPLTNAANLRVFTGPFPVVQLGGKTLVQAVCNAAANAGGTGKLVVRVDYLVPGEATS